MDPTTPTSILPSRLGTVFVSVRNGFVPMATALLSRPEDIPALWEVGLLFGGLALFWVALRLVQHHECWILILFSSLWGFLIGGYYGDHHSPVSPNRLLAAQEHLRAVAAGTAAGVMIGASAALVLSLFIATWRASKQAKARAIIRELAAKKALAAAKAAQEQAIFPPPPRLLLTHFRVQQFLREKTNRN
jgi:hypothetical protein